MRQLLEVECLAWSAVLAALDAFVACEYGLAVCCGLGTVSAVLFLSVAVFSAHATVPRRLAADYANELCRYRCRIERLERDADQSLGPMRAALRRDRAYKSRLARKGQG